MVTVAMDVQGAEVVRPWIDRAGAEYVVLVDRDNVLGGRFGFKYVPLTILIDERGRVVRGPRHTDIRSEPDREALLAWIREGRLLSNEKAGEAEGAGPASGFATPAAELRFALGRLLLESGRKAPAVKRFRLAAEADPKNWIIRKQIWAIEHPERFYDGEVDFAWQKQELRREDQRGRGSGRSESGEQ